MSADSEWEAWRRQWMADPSAGQEDRLAGDAKKQALRESRRMRNHLIAPVLVTVVVGGSVALQAFRTAQPEDIALAVEAWLFILVVWMGSLWLARGTWRAFGETTAAFIDLSIRRRRANLAAITFATWLYIGQLLAVVLLKLAYSTAGPSTVLTSLPVVLLGGIGFPALLAGGAWFRRKQRAELEYLLDLKRQLASG